VPDDEERHVLTNDDAELAELYGPGPSKHVPPDFSELKRRMAAGEADTMDEPPPLPEALHWPSIPADEAAEEWEDLRAWVSELLSRFEFIDHHYVPACWWQHNELVEVLSALRGHESMSFVPGQPPTAATDFFRAMRDLLGIAKSWTDDLGCAAGHTTHIRRSTLVDEDEWQAHVDADVVRRGGTPPG